MRFGRRWSRCCRGGQMAIRWAVIIRGSRIGSVLRLTSRDRLWVFSSSIGQDWRSQ